VTAPSVGIANHRFAYGYYRQTFWNWLIGIAFFLGGVGAGLFVIALLTNHTAGMLAGYLIVVVGKNTAHMLFLGRPERFWRAAMRPDRSWIARGIWAMGLFGLTGLLLLLPRVFGTAWQLSGWLNNAVTAVAILSAVIIMFYDGFVMNCSPGVAFWRTHLLPLLLLMYTTLGGTTLSLTIRELRGETAPGFLPNLEHGLLVVNFVLLAAYLARMSRSLPAARETLRQWLSGPYAGAFFGLVLLVGLLATLLLSVVQNQVHTTGFVLLIAACELTGDFTLMMVLLKSGLFPPQTAAAYSARGAKLVDQSCAVTVRTLFRTLSRKNRT
jgi:sulfite dehydrogenase (quinone) subunit SoeC